MSERPFVHLRGMSAYSLLKGALPVKKLVALARKYKLPALALVDQGNLFGALEFSEAAAGAGIQPIAGVAMPLACEPGENGAAAKTRVGEVETCGSVVLLAASQEGYGTLMRLASRAFLRPDTEEAPSLSLQTLREDNAGLLMLTGGENGPINGALRIDHAGEAASLLASFHEIFGDRLYIELQRYGRTDEARIEAGLLDLAYQHGIPIVATNETYFAQTDDFVAHDALMCLSAGTVMSDDSREKLTADHRFRSMAEMATLFADLPEALESTVEIARRCHVRPQMHAPILPRFTADGSLESEDLALNELARAGLEKRLEAVGPADGHKAADYHDRLEFELSVIQKMKYAGYFLIVSDFIRWAKLQEIPVGPGRGSGAGSVVAWALTITDLDPIRFGLLFERFLNPERVSMPDFDIDFCPERRDEVIRYVQNKYGVDQVAQIITFGTLQARAVIRDVGRVYQMRYGQVDALCKQVPFNPSNPVSLAEALETEPELQAARDDDPAVAQLLSTAVKLEGLYRHPSTHAAGIVIGDRPLEQIVPMFRDPRSDMPVTQFNMKWAEKVGLVKFDFLGLKTLTIIEKTVTILRGMGVEVDPDNLPLDDVKSYELMSDGDTVGVFQLESAGMRDALRTIKPDRFEDIIALVALYRPGPMDNIPTYGARKAGLEEPDYLHPKLEPTLKETYGVIIYQEQVMEIARLLSGYSLGEADLLRRAMGKKIRAEMDQQRERFVEGAVAQGVEKAQAVNVFELVAKFADYGFNKSHAAAYALIAYQTAYLKANYPVAFFAASMTLDMGNTDKLSEFYRDARRRQIELKPPSINQSAAEFIVRDNAIYYALAALKNVGRVAVDELIGARGERPFADFRDFATRADPKSINKRALESLSAAGAFDELEPNRAAVHAASEFILGRAVRASEDRAIGQGGFFAEAEDDMFDLPQVEPWLPADRLTREFQAIGFFLSGHPLDDYLEGLEKAGVSTSFQFHEMVKRGANAGRVMGIVTQRQIKRGRKGSRYGIYTFSDPAGQFEVFAFSESMIAFDELLVVGSQVIVSVEGEVRNGELRMTLNACESLELSSASARSELQIFLEGPGPIASISRRLDKPGSGVVILYLPLQEPKREIQIRLPGGYSISPEIGGAIKAIPGVAAVELT